VVQEMSITPEGAGRGDDVLPDNIACCYICNITSGAGWVDSLTEELSMADLGLGTEALGESSERPQFQEGQGHVRWPDEGI
jgi:hypothetical protein